MANLCNRTMVPLLLYGVIIHLVIQAKGVAVPRNPEQDYFKHRGEFIRKEHSRSIGASLELTKQEQLVDQILMQWKNNEFETGLENPHKFWAGQHFFKVRGHIEQTDIFKFIQKLPKGGSLHSHDTAMVCDDYVFNNITFRSDLYASEDSNGTIHVKFSRNSPGDKWLPLATLRQRDGSVDSRLRQQMTLIRDDPEIFYADSSLIWNDFENIFVTTTPLLTYKPVFKDYFYQALDELRSDNVKYVEFRGLLPPLYDLDGNVYNAEDVLQLYYETSQEFMRDHPDFWGVRFIFAPHRVMNDTTAQTYYRFVTDMLKKYPDFVAGFDLVGHEDAGEPLKNFIPSLLKMKEVTKLFFHAGETLWNGVTVDENLEDAVLLNTTRIGHGYAILKHPSVMEIVKERGIGLEICPISNQVLGLVKDLRNHPANYLIANNYPVVIAPDDPSFWGAKALSYDWYMAFMGMSSRHTGLRLLKQLAMNSLIYSSLSFQEKQDMLVKWNEDWSSFIEGVLDDYLI